MAGNQGQNESSTPLNPGAGGDSVRDLSLTPPSTATAVKQQVVSEGDPVLADALGAVSPSGARYVRADEILRTQQQMLHELRLIAWALGELIGKFTRPYPDDFPTADQTTL